MRYKGFSLIEVLFAIAIISIIVTVAVPKFQDTLEQGYTKQIKTTILLIREGITRQSNTLILQNNSEGLESLDEDSTNLFSKVLNTPIISSNESKINHWSKLSDTSYKVFINSTDSVTFTYDSSELSFDCDYSDSNCVELSQ